MRAITLSILIFVAGSLVGPLIRWATWPPGPTGMSADFVYDLVLLLWPTQPLGVIEASTSTSVAIAVSVGANALLFGVVGAFAGVLGEKKAALIALYVATCALLVVLAVWGFGSSFSHSNFSALVAALFVYALLFFSVFHLARSTERKA